MENLKQEDECKAEKQKTESLEFTLPSFKDQLKILLQATRNVCRFKGSKNISLSASKAAKADIPLEMALSC